MDEMNASWLERVIPELRYETVPGSGGIGRCQLYRQALLNDEGLDPSGLQGGWSLLPQGGSFDIRHVAPGVFDLGRFAFLRRLHATALRSLPGRNN